MFVQVGKWQRSKQSFANSNCVEFGVFKKSSYSGGNGGGCLEVGAFTKSSFSASGECVEVSIEPQGDSISPPANKADEALLYVLRDSKNPDDPKLYYTPDEWAAFIAGVKDDQFDPVELLV